MRIEKVKQTSKQNKLIICSKTKLLIELSSRRKVWHRNISPVSTNETKQALSLGEYVQTSSYGASQLCGPSHYQYYIIVLPYCTCT